MSIQHNNQPAYVDCEPCQGVGRIVHISEFRGITQRFSSVCKTCGGAGMVMSEAYRSHLDAMEATR